MQLLWCYNNRVIRRIIDRLWQTSNVTGAGGTAGHPSNGRTLLVKTQLTYQQSMAIQEQHKMMFFKLWIYLLKQ